MSRPTELPPEWHLLADGSYAKASHRKYLSVKPSLASDAVDKEAKLHAQIVAYCHSKGWVPHHSRMDRPSTCGVGSPDFIIAMQNRKTIYIEAKSKTGKLSREQAAWIAALRRHGHTAEVVRSMSEFLRVTEEAMR